MKTISVFQSRHAHPGRRLVRMLVDGKHCGGTAGAASHPVDVAVHRTMTAPINPDRSAAESIACVARLVQCDPDALVALHLLGGRREGITEAALGLQRSEVIRYARGHVTVLDRTGLEPRACECYAVVKNECDRLLPDSAVPQPSHQPCFGYRERTPSSRPSPGSDSTTKHLLAEASARTLT